MTPLTQTIAEFVHAADLDTFPEAARDGLVKVIADTFAVALAGSRSELREPLRDYVRRAGLAGSCRTIGGEFSLPADAAALVDGAFGAALDFDDVMPMMPGHPSAIVIACALAALRDTPISGKALIDAHIVAVEVGAKLGLGLTKGHYDRGFHGTGTLGIFVGVATLARLRRLPVETTRTAFGIAASLSSGIKGNFGTMTKALHTGWAAQHAVTAVTLAESGVTASAAALEGHEGYFAAYGTPESDPMKTLDSLGHPWAVLSPGVGLRRFACYNGIQRAMHGILQLREQLDMNSASTAQVTCLVPPGSISGAVCPQPRSGLEAKFSMPYVLAAGIVDGGYTLGTFTNEAVARPEIQRLMPLIEVRETAECAQDHADADGNEFGSRAGFMQVSATLRSGRSGTFRVSVAPGHPSRALTWPQLSSKIIDCLRFGGFDEARAQGMARSLQSLASVASIDGVVGALTRVDVHAGAQVARF